MNRIEWSLLALMLVLAATLAAPAVAQDEGDLPDATRAQIQDRAQARLETGEGEQAGDAIRTREQVRATIQQRIEGDEALNEQERLALQNNLQQAVRLGLDAEELDVLFDEGGDRIKLQTRTRLRLQECVLEAAAEDLPVEPIMNKLREGQLKGAGDEARLRVAEKVEAHVRNARQLMQQVGAEGAAVPEGTAERNRFMGAIADCQWRGLEQGDLDQLRLRTRDRLQDGSCQLEEIAAAAETAVQLRERGVEREQAVKMAGEALAAGYTTREMQQIRAVVRAQDGAGEGPIQQMVREMARYMNEGLGAGEMFQQMAQSGWMGPVEDHGPGGGQPIDDMGGGPGTGEGPGDGTGTGDGTGDGSNGGMGGGGDDGSGRGGQ